MSTLHWAIIDNTFDNATKGSNVKAQILIINHNAEIEKASKLNPEFLELYIFSHPFFKSFLDTFTQWNFLRSTNPANKLSVTQFLEILRSTKVRQ